MSARFIGSEIYRGSSYGAQHPLRIPRVSTVIDIARALDWFPPGSYLTSPRAKPEALAAWHTPAYIAALRQAEADGAVSPEVRARHQLGTASNPVYPEVFRRPATAAGGSLMAVGLLRDGGEIHNPGGGTHHGMPDRANGFCYLNDPALAIAAFLRTGAARVSYVDIDAHHCDGVTHGFADNPAVQIISTHERRRWPFTGALDDRGAGNVWNMPVPRGFNDSEMEMLRDRVILPRVAAFRPDALILQCGADALLEDPLSRLALSNEAHLGVLAGLRGLAPRLLVLGGGGYNPWSVARLWTRVWGALAGRTCEGDLPPAASAVLRGLSFSHRLGRNPPEHWMSTLADAPRPGPVSDDVRAVARALEARGRNWD